jgi:glycosyltransferase involved in cell wall biosynthesis
MTDASPTDRLSGTPLKIVVLNWRDTRNPEGGGSERYIESVCRRLAAAGHQVTVACAAHDAAPADETADGVRFRRRGGKLTVYPRALRYLWRVRRTADVVVDVQNGVPFFSRLVTRRPVVVLVHHVHREQWPVVYGPVAARFGWWLESWLAPRAYRGSQYVAVSQVTRRELVGLGVNAGHVAVVHNGTDPPPPTGGPAATPTLCVLGRLVPHKRVEYALRVTAALRADMPRLRLLVVGDGWWSEQLREEAERLGVSDITTFAGHVSESDKHHLVASAWVHLAPSLKEGWGLNVMEAASHGVPTVAFDDAGGLSESVVDGVTGRLVPDLPAFTEAVRQLLTDEALRLRLGSAARQRSLTYHWDRTARSFERVLREAVAGDWESGVDPERRDAHDVAVIDLRDRDRARHLG